MASSFIQIGGRPVFISDDERCATNTGAIPCQRKPAVWIIEPLRPTLARTNPEFRRGMAITPKCQVHFRELGIDPESRSLIWLL